MSPEAFEAAALALPATEKVVQWGGADVYKVGGRIFALRTLEGALSIKVSDIAYAVLVETGRPGRRPIWRGPSGWPLKRWKTWTPRKYAAGWPPPTPWSPPG